MAQVLIHVKSEAVDAFNAATVANARQSLEARGVACFDVIQQREDQTTFMLVEVYRTDDAAAHHTATAPDATGRDTVADMLAEPRTSIRYVKVFPDDSAWVLPDAV